MHTTTNNNLSAYIANTSVVDSLSFFGKYQDTAVGCELTIRTIDPPSISAKPYREVMIAIFFFRRIFSLSSSPSFTIIDLTAMVTAYFTMPTGSAEREVERIVKLVRHAIFDIGNIQGIGFLYSSRKKNMVSENRAANITSFFFRSTVLASALDQRFHSTTLSLDFLLRLQYSVISTALALAPTLVSSIRTPSGTPSLTMVQTPASRPTSILALNNATDDVLNLMDVT